MSIPKIKTFEGGCRALKLNPAKVVPIVKGMPKHHQDAIVAHAKLVIIAEALNGGWKPNWNNTNEWKYYPWFRMSGSGLAYGDCAIDFSLSSVGSRLCFKTRDLAEYAGKQFKKLYTQYFLLK
jgi:hypothetical protein